MAKIPENRISHTIEEMRAGDVGYTTPWAMSPDSAGHMYLNGQYVLVPSPRGTVEMRVFCVEPGHYTIALPQDSEYRWTKGKTRGPNHWAYLTVEGDLGHYLKEESYPE